MVSNKILGLIFPNSHDGNLEELTSARCLGSVPFGARYTLVDFVLSNFIYAGITDIGVIPRKNYQSLMEHIGLGRDWDLARKTGGLSILPPYARSDIGKYSDRIQALESVRDFILSHKADTLVLADCDCVCSMELEKALEQHNAAGADITLVCTAAGNRPLPRDAVYLEADGENRVTRICTSPVGKAAGTVCMNYFIVKAELLTEIVHELDADNKQDFNRDFLQANLGKLDIRAYRFEGYTGFVADTESFFTVNSELLRPEVRRELFTAERPILTRVRDEAPVLYGVGSEIRNSLVADGCRIDGSVENSIISRAVHVGKGCRITNCILMRGVEIGDGAELNYVIADKDSDIRPGRKISGCGDCPVVVGKNKDI